MLTETQKSYELCMIQLIDACAHHPQEYIELTDLFVTHKESYYEALCDNLYHMANHSSNLSLWLRTNGTTYLSIVPEEPFDLLLLFQPNTPPFDGDIRELLKMCQSRLEYFTHSLIHKRKFARGDSALTAY